MQKHLVVFCAVIGFTAAAMALGKLPEKPEKFKDVEGCYITDLDEVIPYGSSRPSKTSCMEFSCGTEFIQILTCGVAVAIPPLKLVEHLDQPYPGCCPTLVEEDDPAAVAEH